MLSKFGADSKEHNPLNQRHSISLHMHQSLLNFLTIKHFYISEKSETSVLYEHLVNLPSSCSITIYPPGEIQHSKRKFQRLKTLITSKWDMTCWSGIINMTIILLLFTLNFICTSWFLIYSFSICTSKMWEIKYIRYKCFYINSFHTTHHHPHPHPRDKVFCHLCAFISRDRQGCVFSLAIHPLLRITPIIHFMAVIFLR